MRSAGLVSKGKSGRALNADGARSCEDEEWSRRRRIRETTILLVRELVQVERFGGKERGS